MEVSGRCQDLGGGLAGWSRGSPFAVPATVDSGTSHRHCVVPLAELNLAATNSAGENKEVVFSCSHLLCHLGEDKGGGGQLPADHTDGMSDNQPVESRRGGCLLPPGQLSEYENGG